MVTQPTLLGTLDLSSSGHILISLPALASGYGLQMTHPWLPPIGKRLQPGHPARRPAHRHSAPLDTQGFYRLSF